VQVKIYKLRVKMFSITKWLKWKCVQCEKQIVSSVKYQSREGVLSVLSSAI